MTDPSEEYNDSVPKQRDKASRHVIRRKKKEAAILRRNIRLGLPANYTTNNNTTNNNSDKKNNNNGDGRNHQQQQSSIVTNVTSLTKRLLFPGRHKWLGGAIDEETGKIYGVPSHSHHIICITPPPPPPPPPPSSSSSPEKKNEAEEATQPIVEIISLPNHDTKIKETNFKWLRGIITNGCLYGIPAWSNHGVLKVQLRPNGDHEDGTNRTRWSGRRSRRYPRVTLLPLPNTTSPTSLIDTTIITTETNESSTPPTPNQTTRSVDLTRWMWHGGALNTTADSIYCVPSNADRVLKINLRTEEVTTIGPATRGSNKWYGGIRGVDGCIYGMPYAATGVLRINPRCDSVEVLGDFPAGGYKWHGGLLAHSTGTIYAFPAHANEVLCVDTNVRRSGATTHTKHGEGDGGKDCGGEEKQDDGGDQSWRVYTIPIRRDPEDTDPPDLQYKWLGGSYGADGCIYGMPSDATSILRIDPLKNEASTFGKVIDTKNKWQGGVLSPVDNCVYAVPADSDCILKIDTNPNTPLMVDTTIGTDMFPSGSDCIDLTDKWQGGFLGRDGNIYGIPENFDRIMKLTPGEKPSLTFLS